MFVGEPALAQDFRLSLIGEPELYLSRQDMACGRAERGSGLDVTDVPVTAFRRKDGSVVVVSGNQNNYYLEGPSVDEAKRTSCATLIPPVNDPDPKNFNARRWLFALYAKSYDLVLGIVHNEYHGNDHFPDQCKVSSPNRFECWYGATTLVDSKDGGFTFETPLPPDNALATLPWRFQPGKLRSGANTPKVVGNPHDGMVYVMINYLDLNRGMRAKQCLLRGSGKAFNDWRAWDGHGFNLDMESPYVAQRSKDCEPVIPHYVSSVKYIPSLDRFIALGERSNRVVYAFSTDLIKWSQPQVLMTFQQKQKWEEGLPPARSYFSLLDPSSSSINFDTLEGRPYLYFVQYSIDGRRFRHKRDIYRQRLSLQ